MSHCESELLIEIQEIIMEQLHHICILPSLNTKMLSKYLNLKQLSVHFFWRESSYYFIVSVRIYQASFKIP